MNQCGCGCGTLVKRAFAHGHNQRGAKVLNRKRQPLDERFWSKVNKDGPLVLETPCWVWTGNHNSAGYGMFFAGDSADDSMSLVHRVSYEMEYGPIPEGLELDHLCETTDCMRSTHLEPVTHQEDIARAYRRRRARMGAND